MIYFYIKFSIQILNNELFLINTSQYIKFYGFLSIFCTQHIWLTHEHLTLLSLYSTWAEPQCKFSSDILRERIPIRDLRVMLLRVQYFFYQLRRCRTYWEHKTKSIVIPWYTTLHRKSFIWCSHMGLILPFFWLVSLVLNQM